MNRARFGDLEVLCRMPAGEARPTPLLFVHGAYTAAWCWDENFLPWFAEQGYAAYAVSLSGHGASRGRPYLDSFSIADYVADVAEVLQPDSSARLMCLSVKSLPALSESKAHTNTGRGVPAASQSCASLTKSFSG